VEGETFTLTANLDTLNGTSGPDKVTGFVSATANASTLTGGDQIDGKGGSDTLEITIDTNVLANTLTPQLTSIENITIRNLSAVANIDELNLVQTTGVTSVVLTNSLGTGDTDVTNAPISATYGISNTPAAAAGGAIADLSVTFDAGALSGTADTAKFSASGAGSKAATNVADRAIISVVNAAGVEAVSLATSGTNRVTVNGGGNDTTTLTVTGDGTNDISIADFNATLNLNASATTGSNTFTLGANLTSADTVSGGTGADVLSIASTGSATSVTVAGVETLRLEQGTTNNVNIGFASASFTTVEVRESTNSVILTGLGAGHTLSFVGADNTGGSATFGLGNSSNDTTFGTIQYNTAFAGSNDTLAVRLGNQGVNSAGAYQATVRASGIENVTIAQADINSSATGTYTVTNTGLKTVAVTSAGNAALTVDTRADQAPNFSGTASTASSNSITLVDFSGVVGTSTLTVSGGTANASSWAAASELRTAQGGMTFTFGVETATDVITVTGNAGVDNITTGSTGSFVANLGAGNDVFSANNIAIAGNGTVNVSGGDGDDNLTGGINADTLNGGAGADTISGGRGADIINGGTGADTIRLTAGAAALAGTNQITTITPVGIDNTDWLNVTIGGVTYSTKYDTAVKNTVEAFVAAHAVAIRGATGGAVNGIIVTENDAQLVFTATGTSSTAADGVVTATGYTFTAPTATITLNENNGASAGRPVVNALFSWTVTPVTGTGDAAKDFAAGDSFPVTAGGATATVTFATDVATSLALFAASNPTLGGYTVVAGAAALTLYQTASSAATATKGVPTAAAGTGTSAAVVANETDLTTTDQIAGVSAAAAGPSHSSYLVTGTGVNEVITSTIDVLTYEQGDVIDYTTSAIAIATADAGVAGTRAVIGATGIATFLAAPGSFNAALTQIAASIQNGVTVVGESVVFQFGGKTYVYISDAADGHSAADTVVEIVGVPATLTSGLTITGGDITGIA
jgi:S-layer protein